MEHLVSIIAFGAIIFAFVLRLIEQDREEKRKERMMNRTNTSVWVRSKKR